jgi:hypothetical protein
MIATLENGPEVDQLERAIEQHQTGSNKNYLPEGRQLLELIKVMPI